MRVSWLVGFCFAGTSFFRAQSNFHLGQPPNPWESPLSYLLHKENAPRSSHFWSHSFLARNAGVARLLSKRADSCWSPLLNWRAMIAGSLMPDVKCQSLRVGGKRGNEDDHEAARAQLTGLWRTAFIHLLQVRLVSVTHGTRAPKASRTEREKERAGMMEKSKMISAKRQ